MSFVNADAEIANAAAVKPSESPSENNVEKYSTAEEFVKSAFTHEMCPKMFTSALDDLLGVPFPTELSTSTIDSTPKKDSTSQNDPSPKQNSSGPKKLANYGIELPDLEYFNLREQEILSRAAQWNADSAPKPAENENDAKRRKLNENLDPMNSTPSQGKDVKQMRTVKKLTISDLMARRQKREGNG